MSIDALNTPSFVFVHLTTILRTAYGFSLLLVMLACRDPSVHSWVSTHAVFKQPGKIYDFLTVDFQGFNPKKQWLPSHLHSYSDFVTIKSILKFLLQK